MGAGMVGARAVGWTMVGSSLMISSLGAAVVAVVVARFFGGGGWNAEGRRRSGCADIKEDEAGGMARAAIRDMSIVWEAELQGWIWRYIIIRAGRGRRAAIWMRLKGLEQDTSPLAAFRKKARDLRFFSTWFAVWLLISGPGVAAQSDAVLSEQALMLAFSEVFGVRDVVLDAGSPLMECALRQLDQLGVPRGIVAMSAGGGADMANASSAYGELMRRGLGSQAEAVLAGMLMRAALGNIVLGLKDPSDWSLVMLDPATGDLVRRRSFSSTRLAVIETLLLICIVALGRMVWVYKI